MPTRLIPLLEKATDFNNGLPSLHTAWKAEDSFPDPSRLMQGGIYIAVCGVREEG